MFSLDLSLLTAKHLFLFFCSFWSTHGLIVVLKQLRPAWLPFTDTTQKIMYFGVGLVAVVLLWNVFLLPWPLWIGLALAALIIAIAGSGDEHAPKGPLWQLLWQILAALPLVMTGWLIRTVTNPLAAGVIEVGSLGPYLTIGWLVLLMNAINWLDGSDGLAGSVVSIAFLALAAISLLPMTQDSLTLTLALVGFGCTLAFLAWNAPPAAVYLGTVGSWFAGLYLGSVAIVGGGKVVTTILVLAIPIIDLALVVMQRLIAHRPPWQADRTRHIHYRLLAAGFSPQAIMGLVAAATILLAAAAIVLQTSEKILVLVGVSIIMVILAVVLAMHVSLPKQ